MRGEDNNLNASGNYYHLVDAIKMFTSSHWFNLRSSGGVDDIMEELSPLLLPSGDCAPVILCRGAVVGKLLLFRCGYGLRAFTPKRHYRKLAERSHIFSSPGEYYL